MLAYLFVSLQYLLPKHFLTAMIWRLARVRHVATKDFLISRFVTLFNVDIDDVKETVPDDFATFNAFFIRELQDSARPIDTDPQHLVSPVDGTVSVADQIRGDSIIQAKGFDYSVGDLLATDLDAASAFVGGHFATIYLAPYNYHRVHAALGGKLVAATYIPGDLFSVNEATVARVPGLFRRNERLVMHFKSPVGPTALVFVGALNVGSISTPWTGEIRPRKSGVIDVLDLGGHDTHIEKGDLLGWFNMGSTVIVLMPPGACRWRPQLQPGQTLRMGEAIGDLPGTRDDAKSQ